MLPPPCLYMCWTWWGLKPSPFVFHTHWSSSEPIRLTFVSSENTTSFRLSIDQCWWALAHCKRLFLRFWVRGSTLGLWQASRFDLLNKLRTAWVEISTPFCFNDRTHSTEFLTRPPTRSTSLLASGFVILLGRSPRFRGISCPHANRISEIVPMLTYLVLAMLRTLLPFLSNETLSFFCLLRGGWSWCRDWDVQRWCVKKRDEGTKSVKN